MSSTKPSTQGETEIAAAVAAGFESAGVANRFCTIAAPPNGVPLHESIPIALTASGDVKVAKDVLDIVEARLSSPRRFRGTAISADVDSFIEYVDDHRTSQLEMWLDPAACKAVAVFNGHGGWGDNRAEFTATLTPEWAAWRAACNKPHTQEAFGELLEQRFEEIASPKEGTDQVSALVMMQVARDLQINSVGTFKRKIDRATGTGSLIWESEHGPGSTVIPKAFSVMLRPWEGATPFRVEVRVRFELKEKDGPRFTLVMHREQEVLREAFKGLAGEMDARLNEGELLAVPIYIGKPPAPLS
jgi:uncharacterized protein YfdQ (DUF2303 family)